MSILDQIHGVLVDLYRLNGETPSSLVGGAYCAEVAREPDGLPWIQAKVGALNLFWPFDDPPLARLAAAGLPVPSGTTCPDWKAETFATLEFPPPSPLELAAFVEALFVKLYGFDEPFTVTTELFDMRSS